MSPTATIASVVVALLFFAWLFQSDIKDPGYEAWVKRQQEEMKNEKAQKASMGIALTDAGVTKDNSTVDSRRSDAKGSGGYVAGDVDLVLKGTDGVPLQDPTAEISIEQRPKDEDAEREANKNGFGKGMKLNGTFVGVGYVGDAPTKGVDEYDSPSITFRRDGGFSTQNMGAAEVDMEAGGTGGTVDRGSGRYRLFENTLELTFTDGLTRKKGSKRTYTVVPVSGPEKEPTAITIQGKIFKLDASR